jgi:hypothetical protein
VLHRNFTCLRAIGRNFICLRAIGFPQPAPQSLANAGSIPVPLFFVVAVVGIVSYLLLSWTATSHRGLLGPKNPKPIQGIFTTQRTNAVNSGHFYSTNFQSTESPISEAGHWVSGSASQLGWDDVYTSWDVDSPSGKAFGTQIGNEWKDSIAALTGSWGPDQGVQAKISAQSGRYSPWVEVEIHLRQTITAGNATGYEFYCSLAPSQPYFTIVVWPPNSGPDHPGGSYTQIANRTDIGCADGDVLGATAVGSTLTFYRNGVPVLTASDSAYLSGGAPGIGFFVNQNTGISTTFGFSNFAADDNGTLPPLYTALPSPTASRGSTSITHLDARQ